SYHLYVCVCEQKPEEREMSTDNRKSRIMRSGSRMTTPATKTTCWRPFRRMREEDEDLSSGKSNEESTTAAGKLLCGVYMHVGKPSAQRNKSKTIQGNVKPGMLAICVRVASFSILQAHIFAFY
ncbi:hypothetical protein GN958_ATG07762, partial [Phytophthora infestans]